MYLFRNFVLKSFRVTKRVVYLGAASEHSLELPQQTLQYFALLCGNISKSRYQVFETQTF